MAMDAFDVVMFAVIIGNVSLGLVIGYQAYRGFRRHESGPMRYLSIGLMLLTAIAYSIAFFGWMAIRFDVLPEAYGRPLSFVYRLVQFAGLSFITYSLYIRD